MGSRKTEFCESCGQPATWYMFCESCRRMRDAVGMVPHVCDQCEATRMSYGPEEIAGGTFNGNANVVDRLSHGRPS